MAARQRRDRRRGHPSGRSTCRRGPRKALAPHLYEGGV